MSELVPNQTETFRCPWCLGFEDYIRYHDEEWGVPVYSDRKHFEFLVLESAQAGLSWATILKKREGYMRAFEDFDYQKVADFTEEEIERLIGNPDIVRNRLKIQAAVNNARKFIGIQEHYGTFTDYIWGFVDGKPLQNEWKSMSAVPAATELSNQIARDLKQKGFKFLGSTIVYSHMQATGIVNDHLVQCHRHQEVKRMAMY
ncbi:DNA-3-methyladenine glycosylase I [Cyclobacterium lianum]|uniref:DNA-3-methyladenine glycosylase I n=1 Tax=Cyclobacterium lianum TaxID=388280 RepID=A0A1M7IKC7_9BACT|nr:DNA-3-methyladenine glycosylase I [Cyclobacterium lianum]SHM41181.1 DNA-3-methyladenine glycosylase I [Cyclobacterium lianum]